LNFSKLASVSCVEVNFARRRGNPAPCCVPGTLQDFRLIARSQKSALFDQRRYVSMWDSSGMISRDQRLAGTVIASVVLGSLLLLSPVDAATVKRAKVTTTKRKAAVKVPTKAKATVLPTVVAAVPTTAATTIAQTTIAPTTTAAAPLVLAPVPAPTTTALANPFTLENSIVTRNVARGTTAKTAIVVNYNPGFSGDLTWTAAPERDGVSLAFTANPTRNVVEIQVTATPSAVLGATIIPLTVRGGGIERAISFVAIVGEASVTPLGGAALLPGQTWSASIDSTGPVPAGSTANVTLRIYRSVDFTSALRVTYVAPDGITISISQNPVADQAIVSVMVASGTPARNYQVTLFLTAGGATSTVVFGVQVP
jgi:hypothetical protein